MARNRSRSRRIPLWFTWAMITALFFILLGFFSLTTPGHWIFIHFFYTKLSFWVPAVILIILFTVLISQDILEEKHLLFGMGGAVLLLGGYLFVSLGMYYQDLAQGVTVAKLEQVPDTRHVRFMPQEVAVNAARNSYQSSSTELTNFEPVQSEDGISWQAAQTPLGFFNYLSGNTQGLTIVTADGEVTSVQSPMSIGEGMFFWRGLNYQVYSRHPFSETTSPYYIQVNGEVLALVPYLGYTFHFPFLNATPYWEGVLVVHPDGQVEDLSPAQAIDDPRFAGQRLYPHELARIIADAWSSRDGFMNAWFTHQDTTKIPDLADTSNMLPYLIPVDINGSTIPMWLTPFEPYGERNYGVSKILLQNAHDGRFSIYTVPTGTNLTGPNLVQQYLRSAYPEYNWRKEDEGGNIISLEPRPLFRDHKLYWLVSITNDSAAGIHKTVLVDAQNGAITEYNSIDELNRFIAGEYIGPSPNETAPGDPTTDITSADLTKLTDEQLRDLINRILDELFSRRE